MSQTLLYKVFKTRATRITEFRNSHGSAPPLWGWLGMNYLGWPSLHEIRPMESLWKLSYDPLVPEDVRLCHAFTFDYAVVKKENFDRMAVACDAVNTLIEGWSEWQGCVNHWGALSLFFKAIKVDSRCLGIGMGCTSVYNEWSVKYNSSAKVRTQHPPFDCVEYVKRWTP